MLFNLSNTELDILEISWATNRWMSGADFWNRLNGQGGNFKRQTVNTYLSRMTDKGFLVKCQTKYIYTFTKEEFEKKRALEILYTMYSGSLKKFLLALAGSVKMDCDEAFKLQDYLEKLLI